MIEDELLGYEIACTLLTWQGQLLSFIGVEANGAHKYVYLVDETTSHPPHPTLETSVYASIPVPDNYASGGIAGVDLYELCATATDVALHTIHWGEPGEPIRVSAAVVDRLPDNYLPRVGTKHKGIAE